MTTEQAHIKKRSPEQGGQSRDLEYPQPPQPLTVPVYDNHTHLEIADGQNPMHFSEHLDRAGAVGVRGVVQVGTDLATSEWSAKTASHEPRMLAAVALHPDAAPGLVREGLLDDQIARIAELARMPRVRAVGETGLDYFHAKSSEDREAQRRSFEAHIQIAKETGLALQIHNREAFDDVVATLDRVGAPERVVFHCFSGDEAFAELCAERGWFMSFAGNVTFKNARTLRAALKKAPRGLIMVETDAPYLTPEPYRGRPNSPYLLPFTLRSMSETTGIDVPFLAAQISSTTELVYGQWDSEPVAPPTPAPQESGVIDISTIIDEERHAGDAQPGSPEES